MLFGSVCSGIEAATAAWEPLGWRPAFFAEIEGFPQAVLRHHHGSNIVARHPRRKSSPRLPGGVPNLGDFTGIRVRDLLRAGIAIPDLLAGGTPCQDFSTAGLRRSLDGDNGNLTLEFVRLAHAIDNLRRHRGQPGLLVLWENVPGVLNTRDNAFGCFLAAMVGCDSPLVPPARKSDRRAWPDAGVVVGPQRAGAWRCLDAQYFGLAQRRKRVFALFGPRNWPVADALFPVGEGLRRDSPPCREAGPAVATLTANGVGASGADDSQARGGHLIAAPVAGAFLSKGRSAASATNQDAMNGLLVAAFGGGNTRGPIDVATARTAHGGPHGRQDFESDTFVVEAIPFDTTQITSAGNFSNPGPGDPCHPLTAGGHAPAIAFNGRQDPVHGPVPGALDTDPQTQCVAIQEIGKRTGVSTDDARCGLGVSRPGDPMYTLQAGAQHGIADRMSVRRLTPREAERLQGFADGHTLVPYRGKPAADGPRYRAIGNSQPVPVMRWLGRRIEAVGLP